MSSQRPGAFNSLRMGGEQSLSLTIAAPSENAVHAPTNPLAEVIRERVQDGVTGETRELQYTQCKIVGNGSFGVVFQTKLSPSGEDAAIKRVLQDKRFKVCISSTASLEKGNSDLTDLQRTVNSKLCALSVTPTLSSLRPSTTPTANE